MIIADSIAKGLRRYINVWNLYFEKHTVNHGIGEDKVENVVWRIGNVNENEELRYVVLICGTNNIDKHLNSSVKASNTQSGWLNLNSTAPKL